MSYPVCYLLNEEKQTGYRLNGIWPSNRKPQQKSLCKSFRDHMKYSAKELPHKIDLRSKMTTVEDQKSVGSCTANALVGAYEYLTKRANGRTTDVSRLFVYYNARVRDGHSHNVSDSGCTMVSAIEALKEFGTCLEDIWPYEDSLKNARPSDKAYKMAADHTITDALEVDVNLYEMKSCLAQGYPFAFGIQTFKSFDKAGSSGVVPMPSVGERSRSSHGSHALLAVGYSDESESFIVRNSWGTKWGDKGYCYLPYDYVANKNYCFDAWVIRQVAKDDFGGQQNWDNNDTIDYRQKDDENDNHNNNDKDNNAVIVQYDNDNNDGQVQPRWVADLIERVTGGGGHGNTKWNVRVTNETDGRGGTRVTKVVEVSSTSHSQFGDPHSNFFEHHSAFGGSHGLRDPFGGHHNLHDPFGDEPNFPDFPDARSMMNEQMQRHRRRH